MNPSTRSLALSALLFTASLSTSFRAAAQTAAVSDAQIITDVKTVLGNEQALKGMFIFPVHWFTSGQTWHRYGAYTAVFAMLLMFALIAIGLRFRRYEGTTAVK